MENIKLGIAYDGTNYCGWQKQNKLKTIQGELENVISKYLNEDINLIGAGRTDSGVHAENQVANFKINNNLDLQKFKFAINKMLSSDISINNIELADENFSARFSATSRKYIYRISTQKNPFLNRFTWQINYDLDFDSMNEAAKIISQQSNFKLLSKNESDTHNFMAIIHKSLLTKTENEFVYQIDANRFLRGMVRGIIGLIVDVGRKKVTIDNVTKYFNGESFPVMFAPPNGLCLKNVLYD
ncbi:MAG: tRNA pseudouridine(38-40) synthase TruA [Bacteroidetes bacterium]|nr:tRNA pseudouridine(38-40) synthase TruA [Bacteroidota bacterium]